MNRHAIPLESEVLQSDNTYFVSRWGWSTLRFASLFRKAKPGTICFDLGVHSLHGGAVRYMNVENPGNQIPESDVMRRFLNTQTHVVHEHHVGWGYSSINNLVEYRFGIAIHCGQ